MKGFALGKAKAKATRKSLISIEDSNNPHCLYPLAPPYDVFFLIFQVLFRRDSHCPGVRCRARELVSSCLLRISGLSSLRSRRGVNCRLVGPSTLK